MPTTRSQDAPKAGDDNKPPSVTRKTIPTKAAPAKRASKAKKPASRKKAVPRSKKQEHVPAHAGEKRKAVEEVEGEKPKQRTSKQMKAEGEEGEEKRPESMYVTGVIERGHIYFFYRPKVELEEALSIDDVQRFYMVLVPRPPGFAAGASGATMKADGSEEEQDMNLIQEGADVVPAEETTSKIKRFRLIVVGKKALPDPEAKGRGRVFWGTIATIGEDLEKLEGGLGASTYETKTRGTRHQASARLAARGAYAIVNAEAERQSQRVTHLGYHLSHPSGDQLGEVQEALGIHQASSFVIQVKNPLAPPTGAAQVGLPKNRRADYPKDILRGVFGMGGLRGREKYGLRFASCEREELLDYEGAELLFIAARSGEEGLEQSLGEGRGHALEETEKSESKEKVDQVLEELALHAEKVPADPLEGEWA